MSTPHIPDWLKVENERRTASYQRDESAESFLFALNEILAPHEYAVDPPDHDPHPLLFIIGVPRAGKTLFSQVLSACLDLGYVDNLIARFWRSPTYGIRLSQIFRENRRDRTFESDYGKTKGIEGPHDFSYFWHFWLKMDAMPYDAARARDHIDWPNLRRQLRRMSAAWGRPGVFKSPNPSYHIRSLAETYSRSLFIHLERDPIDSAISLLRGRIDNFGDANAWYGQWPSKYEHLLDLPFAEQIGGQLAALREMFEEQFVELPSDRVMRMNYASFCQSPHGALESIRSRVHEAFGVKIEPGIEPPPRFAVSRHPKTTEHYDAIAAGLEKHGLPLRFNPVAVS